MKRFQDHHRRPLQKNSGQNISWPGPKRNSAKISTAPQRERSATHKVTRRLREPCQNSQRATTRAIRHTHTHNVRRRLHEPCQNSQRATTRAIRPAQSAERVARERYQIATAPQNERSDTHLRSHERRSLFMNAKSDYLMVD